MTCRQTSPHGSYSETTPKIAEFYLIRTKPVAQQRHTHSNISFLCFQRVLRSIEATKLKERPRPVAAEVVGSTRRLTVFPVSYRRIQVVRLAKQGGHHFLGTAAGWILDASGLLPPLINRCSCRDEIALSRISGANPNRRRLYFLTYFDSLRIASAAFPATTQLADPATTASSSNHKNPKSSMHSGKSGLMMMYPGITAPGM